MMTKGCILAQVLPLRCFLFFVPNYIHVYAIIMQYFSHLDKREVLPNPFIMTVIWLFDLRFQNTFSIFFPYKKYAIFVLRLTQSSDPCIKKISQAQ